MQTTGGQGDSSIPHLTLLWGYNQVSDFYQKYKSGQHIFVNHLDAFSISIHAEILEKIFSDGPVLHLCCWPKTTIVRDHEYFIPTKFHQNTPSSSREKVENMKSSQTTTDNSKMMEDGWCKMTIAHSSFRLLCAKKKQIKSGVPAFYGTCTYAGLSICPIPNAK